MISQVLVHREVRLSILAEAQRVEYAVVAEGKEVAAGVTFIPVPEQRYALDMMSLTFGSYFGKEVCDG